MFRTDVFSILTDGLIHPWRQSFVHGLMFFIWGILILLFPQLLVALVAGFFILIGLLLMFSAWAFRQTHQHFYQ